LFVVDFSGSKSKLYLPAGQLGSTTTFRCSIVTEGHPHDGVLPCTATVSVVSWNPEAVSRSS